MEEKTTTYTLVTDPEGAARDRLDPRSGRGRRHRHRDHEPLPEGRQGPPPPARDPGADLRHRPLRGRGRLPPERGPRGRTGQGLPQLQVRLPVPEGAARHLRRPRLRHDARRAAPRRRPAGRGVRAGRGGRALPGRVAGQVRAAERLVRGAHGAAARVRGARRGRAAAAAREAAGGARGRGARAGSRR